MSDMELTEFEKLIYDLVITWSLPIDEEIKPANKKHLIESIRKIMPPTCTTNERLFLDEIRKYFTFGDYESEKVISFEGDASTTRHSLIYQKNFTADLSQLGDIIETDVDT